VKHISVAQLSQWLGDDSRPLVLLDVREQWEINVCKMGQAIVIPMGQISARADELKTQDEIAIICHHGIRSQRVGQYLESRGFENILNVSGGINAWAKEIDLEMAKY
jgi:rhodanese-related sulfurtransferase